MQWKNNEILKKFTKKEKLYKMKKALIFILAISMIFTLTACGASTQQTAAPTTTAAAATDKRSQANDQDQKT